MNIAVEFADTALQIQKDRKHDWLMPTKDVAAARCMRFLRKSAS